MFEHMQEDDGLFKLHFSPKEEDVKKRLIQEVLPSFDGNFDFSTFSVEIGEELLIVKKVKEQVSQEEVKLINVICLNLKKDISNIIEYVIDKGEKLDNSIFFSLVKESHLSYSFLQNYIPFLSKLELDFDLRLVEKNVADEYFAIDCKDYIKFIPFDQYNKEKQVDQIVSSLSEQTNHEPVREWLHRIYRRYLLNNLFDSNGIHHILDWMNSLENHSVLKESLSYDRALAKADQWVEISNQKLGITTSRDKDGVDVEGVYSNGPFTLFHLLSEDSKKREGQKMHNCIGRLHLKNPNLYYLRLNGRRIASICLEDKRAKEIKGPWNKAVEKTYHEEVATALEAMGVNLIASADLHNIGRRVVKFLEQDILVKEGEPLFYIQSTSKDRIFDGVKIENINKTKEDIVNKFPEGTKEKVKEALDAAEEIYTPCPLTGYMILKSSDYAQYKISKVQKVLNDFSDYKGIWVQSVENYLEQKQKTFLVSHLMAATEDLINNYERIAGDKLKTRAFIKALSSLDYSLSVAPGLFKPIFGKSEDLKSLFQRVVSYSSLNAIGSSMDDLETIKKLKDADFDCEEIEIEEPDDCKHCNNHKTYIEQKEIADDVKALSEDAKDKVKSLNESLGEVHSFASEVMDFYNKFCKSILTDESFDVVEGVIHKKTITKYREFLEDLDTEIENMDNVLSNSSYATLEKSIEEIEKLNGEIEDIQKEIESKLKDLSKSYSSSCGGCSSCGGRDEECEECEGTAQKCDGEEIVDKNQGQHISVDYSFDGFRYRNSVDFEAVLSCYKILKGIVETPREFKKDMVSFFSDYSS